MNIKIDKMKQVIDELQIAELDYKKQLTTFEQVYKEYKSVGSEQHIKLALKKVYDNLEEEYRSLRQTREVLTEVVACYCDTEKKIVKTAAPLKEGRMVLKAMDVKNAKAILEQFNVKFS